jgi:hypothetical protein
MARIKGILNERRLAYEGAVKLLHEQRAQAKKALVDSPDAEVSLSWSVCLSYGSDQA